MKDPIDFVTNHIGELPKKYSDKNKFRVGEPYHYEPSLLNQLKEIKAYGIYTISS